MKKIFYISVLLLGMGLVSNISFAEDFSKSDYLYFSISWASNNIVTPETIYFVGTEENVYDELPRSRFHLDKDGWFYYSDAYQKNLLILGYPSVNFNIGDSNSWKTSEYEKEKGIFYSSNFGASYTATSELKENTKAGAVVYKAENLGKFAYASQSHYSPFAWNYDGKPWVEGVKGDGIGEKLTIRTKEQFHSLIILNGYVCPNKTNLYKKNSRVKAFAVKDLDNNQEYIFNLEDVVEFQSFYFRKKTKNIELTIKEVYKGEKWDDTCITALIPANIYSFGDEDKSQPFEQSYTYKRDKNEVFENIEQIKKSYERISHENDSGDGK